MQKNKHSDPKGDALRQEGSFNPRAMKVRDRLFLENDFFDPRDLVQVKYEMLRRVRVEGQPVSKAADAFGFSRLSLYQAKGVFEERGLPGLVSRKRGPRGAHKLTDDVMVFIERAMKDDKSLRAKDIARLLKEKFGIEVHPRSIERCLARRQKKRR